MCLGVLQDTKPLGSTLGAIHVVYGNVYVIGVLCACRRRLHCKQCTFRTPHLSIVLQYIGSDLNGTRKS